VKAGIRRPGAQPPMRRGEGIHRNGSFAIKLAEPLSFIRNLFDYG